MWAEGPAAGKRRLGLSSPGAYLWSPWEAPACGTQGEQMGRSGTVQPASVFLLLGSAGEGSARHWLSFSFHD